MFDFFGVGLLVELHRFRLFKIGMVWWLLRIFMIVIKITKFFSLPFFLHSHRFRFLFRWSWCSFGFVPVGSAFNDWINLFEGNVVDEGTSNTGDSLDGLLQWGGWPGEVLIQQFFGWTLSRPWPKHLKYYKFSTVERSNKGINI